jgi:hypothetical protein
MDCLSQAIRPSIYINKDDIGLYVKAIDASSANNTSNHFSFKIQDPLKFDLHAFQYGICQKIIDIERINVIGTEVSVDFYRRYIDLASDADMVLATVQLFKNNSFLASENYRITGPKGTKGTAVRKPSINAIQSGLASGLTLFVGNVDDDCTQRYYFKKTDGGGKIHLPEVDYRARAEITLKNAELPFSTLEEFVNFNFTWFAKFFKWRALKEDAPIWTKAKIQTSSHVSKLMVPGSRRKTPKHTAADSKLNERVYDALRSLTKSIQRSQQKCRNSGSEKATLGIPLREKGPIKHEQFVNTMNTQSYIPDNFRNRKRMRKPEEHIRKLGSAASQTIMI